MHRRPLLLEQVGHPKVLQEIPSSCTMFPGGQCANLLSSRLPVGVILWCLPLVECILCGPPTYTVRLCAGTAVRLRRGYGVMLLHHLHRLQQTRIQDCSRLGAAKGTYASRCARHHPDVRQRTGPIQHGGVHQRNVYQMSQCRRNRQRIFDSNKFNIRP